MKEFLLKKLECFNDEEFKFDPAAHRYTYLGEQFTLPGLSNNFTNHLNRTTGLKRKLKKQEYLKNGF